MVRKPAIGALPLMLAALALPTPHKNSSLWLTHRDTRGQPQDVDLADVAQTAEAAQNDSSSLPPALAR
jgi:hypothetical protein